MLGNTVSNSPYLDLLKRFLTNCIDDEHELVPVSPQGLMTPDQLRTLTAAKCGQNVNQLQSAIFPIFSPLDRILSNGKGCEFDRLHPAVGNCVRTG